MLESFICTREVCSKITSFFLSNLWQDACKAKWPDYVALFICVYVSVNGLVMALQNKEATVRNPTVGAET